MVVKRSYFCETEEIWWLRIPEGSSRQADGSKLVRLDVVGEEGGEGEDGGQEPGVHVAQRRQGRPPGGSRQNGRRGIHLQTLSQTLSCLNLAGFQEFTCQAFICH